MAFRRISRFYVVTHILMFVLTLVLMTGEKSLHWESPEYQLFQACVHFLLVIGFLPYLLLGLKTGRLTGPAGRTVSRYKRPIFYWVLFSVDSIGALVFIAATTSKIVHCVQALSH
jgi:hypothetical protein